MFPFLSRSNRPEIIDGGEYTEAELAENLRELEWVNRTLGGARALRVHLFPVLERREAGCRWLDVGCGGADVPFDIFRKARGAGISVQLNLLDSNLQSLRSAGKRFAGTDRVLLIRGDAARLPFKPGSVHILTASLLLHHFSAQRAAELLRHFCAVSRDTVLITDLVRGWIPFLSISLLVRLRSLGRLSRNDAPLSVRRGFRSLEIRRLLKASGARRGRIFFHFPSRFCLLLDGEESGGAGRPLPEPGEKFGLGNAGGLSIRPATPEDRKATAGKILSGRVPPLSPRVPGLPGARSSQNGCPRHVGRDERRGLRRR